jgi:hypothetical protein
VPSDIFADVSVVEVVRTLGGNDYAWVAQKVLAPPQVHSGPVIATQKVTGKVLDAADHKRLIDEAIGELDFSALQQGSPN